MVYLKNYVAWLSPATKNKQTYKQKPGQMQNKKSD